MSEQLVLGLVLGRRRGRLLRGLRGRRVRHGRRRLAQLLRHLGLHLLLLLLLLVQALELLLLQEAVLLLLQLCQLLLLQLVQLVLQGVLLRQRLQRLLGAVQRLRRELQRRLREGVLVARLRGVRLLSERRRLQLHDLRGRQVQHGELRRGLRLRRRRLRGHFELAEQHRAAAHVALLAVIHLLLQVFRRCRKGL